MANGWWNLDGAISSCVLAYQPIGAASYAASKVNLFNPGTSDAGDGAAFPTWAAATGWTANTNDQWLTTGIVPALTYTVIMRFSGNTTAASSPLIASSGASNRFGFLITNAPSIRGCSGGNVETAGLVASGVVCIAGREFFIDAVSKGSVSTGGAPTNPLYICDNPNIQLNHFAGSIQAVAIYDSTLTAEQVGALTTAMNALTGETPEALTAADFTLNPFTFDTPTLTIVSDTEDLTAADFTLSVVTFDAPVLVNVWTTPACRTYSVEAESRAYSVEAESRAYTVSAESRGLKIVCNNAIVYALSYIYNGLTASDFTLAQATFDAPVLTSKLTDGLVAYWKLDESSDGSGAVTRVDTVGDHDLTDNNTTPSGTGISSNCASFTAANSENLSTVAAPDLLGGARDWTIDGWFKLTDRTASVEIISKGSSRTVAALYDYRLYNISNTVSLRVSNGVAVATINLGSAPTNDTWAYFCIYHDATTGKIGGHLNNGLAVEANFTASGTHNPAGNFRIGASPVPDLYFEGSIDEVGRWNRILTIKERLDRWNNGSGNPHPFTSEILWDASDYPVQSGSFTYSSSIEA